MSVPTAPIRVLVMRQTNTIDMKWLIESHSHYFDPHVSVLRVNVLWVMSLYPFSAIFLENLRMKKVGMKAIDGFDQTRGRTGSYTENRAESRDEFHPHPHSHILRSELAFIQISELRTVFISSFQNGQY